MTTAAARARSAVASVLRLMPESWRLALAPSLAGYTRDEIPAPLRGPGMLIAPANSAGQAHAWAHAVTTFGGTRAVNLAIVAENDAFRYPADTSVRSTIASRSALWSRGQARAAASFQSVVIESGRAPFGVPSGDIEDQVAALRAAGVDVRLLWHGSDIRSPRRNAEIEPFSPFAETDDYSALLQEGADRNAALADKLGLVEFVSTPDLLRDRPNAVWVPVVVDLDRWQHHPWSPGERLRVLHAPSRRRLKGTELVWDALQRLHAEGVIDLVVAEGIAHADMPALVASCDVVLDQFALGIYGVAALEGLAAGRLVISHIAPDVRAAAEAAAGRDLPVVEATADTLENLLREIATAPEPYRSIAETGRDFVAALHDGRRSAAVLTEAREAHS